VLLGILLLIWQKSGEAVAAAAVMISFGAVLVQMGRHGVRVLRGTRGRPKIVQPPEPQAD
jgi:hypothetical protein